MCEGNASEAEIHYKSVKPGDMAVAPMPLIRERDIDQAGLAITNKD